MNDGAMIGIIGGIAGALLGISGGLVGTYFGIRNTAGPRSKRFLIRVSIIAWIFVALFLTVLLLMPADYKVFAWIPYAIILALGIIYINKRLNKLTVEDKAAPPSDVTEGAQP